MAPADNVPPPANSPLPAEEDSPKAVYDLEFAWASGSMTSTPTGEVTVQLTFLRSQERDDFVSEMRQRYGKMNVVKMHVLDY